MGIAGFYLWLQRNYRSCIEDVPERIVQAALNGEVFHDRENIPRRFDNLYLDMNGLIHPCCHDTAPLPEPKSEEEMLDRIFEQIDILFKVVRPRKCLVLCIDGVAPQSKMNQQRSRRFRAADERIENDALSEECAEEIVKRGLPRPNTGERWDHNVITPSTAFMERVGFAIEWFIVKKLNEDPAWRHVVVVFSDAHVPGEGEHKIMQYIRGLRAQRGYNPLTTHVIHGMDADLVCLGISTHEEHVTILRNQLTETFQPDHNGFCYFDLYKFRLSLKEDFKNIGNMIFERVLDDFVFLCFFVGNDFLPHVPLISIKTKGIELLLDHYVIHFGEHSYLTDKGEVNFEVLSRFMQSFVRERMDDLKREYGELQRAKDRAKVNVEERLFKAQKKLKSVLLSVDKDGANAQEVSDEAHKIMLSLKKEQLRFVADKQPLGFSYAEDDHRDSYYTHKFGWNPEHREEFEKNIQLCCSEYLRGTQWVMRYYTSGCPSWDWYYPYHYAPLFQDLAKFGATVDVEMVLGTPRHPVVQLLSVLPRQSLKALPEVLHHAVADPNSVLGAFYPERIDVDLSEANFSYQGVLRLPFINSQKLQCACEELVELEPDDGVTLLFCHASHFLSRGMENLLTQCGSTKAMQLIPREMVAKIPIAGHVGRYEQNWPRGSKLTCPDRGIVSSTKYGSPIRDNKVFCYRYELNTHARYMPKVLKGRTDTAKKSLTGTQETTGSLKAKLPPPSSQFDKGKENSNRDTVSSRATKKNRKEGEEHGEKNEKKEVVKNEEEEAKNKKKERGKKKKEKKNWGQQEKQALLSPPTKKQRTEPTTIDVKGEVV